MKGRDQVRSALLGVGALLIIGSGAYTLTHLTDAVVLTVLLPGFAAGLILIGVYRAAAGVR